jgi:putative ABC transport system ATP-binding protein
MTVQKSFTILLTGGTIIFLQTFVGLTLLAFYHPYFLLFDFILIILLYLVWFLFGKKAIITAINESNSKYKVANWLEEIARENLFFKTRKRKDAALKISDSYILNYLKDRKSHFKKVFGQEIFLLTIYALMSSLILGLGGFLVMKGQLTLGQLVAAELIVTLILSSFSQFQKYLDAFYDLIAAIEKLSHFYDIPTKREAILESIKNEDNELKLSSVFFKDGRYNFLYNYTFERGKNYFIQSKFFSTKLVFLDLVQGLIKPLKGSLQIGGINYNQISSLDIRDFIYVVDRPIIFTGKLIENLTIGVNHISHNEIRDILDLVDLWPTIEVLKKGLETEILPSGYPLWPSQLLRLEIARAIINRPKVIIITENFDRIEEDRKAKILNYLLRSEITLLVFSNKTLSDIIPDKNIIFSRDKILEKGAK